MSKKTSRSLSYFVHLWMGCIMIIISLLIFFNNRAAFSFLRNQLYQNAKDNLVLYQKEIDEELGRISRVLYNIYFQDVHFAALDNTPAASPSRMQNLYHVQNSLTGAQQIYPAADLFCFFPDTDNFIYVSTDKKTSFQENKNDLRTLLASGHILNNQWFFTESNNQAYLYFLLPTRKNYLGCRVRIDHLFGLVADKASSNQLELVSASGSPLLKQDPGSLIFPPEGSDYLVQNIHQESVLCIFPKIDSGDFYLARLIPISDLLRSLHPLHLVTIVVLISFFCIWGILYGMVRSKILRPVGNLTTAIRLFQDGHTSPYVPAKKQPYELKRLSEAFNQMIAEIRDLHIDIYEKKLKHQNLEIQFLKLQITPHFFINCLNMVDALMDTGHFDLAKEMLSSLSEHLRYTLSSGQTVPLGKELELAKNYIRLSGIRYPKAIQYSCHCPEHLYACTAIPLLIINFIENSIKYEVSLGKVLEIQVEISEISRNEEEILYIRIEHNGRGFSPEILKRLKNPEAAPIPTSNPVGIANIIQRCTILYPFHDFSFSNRDEGGARVEIYLSKLMFHSSTTSKIRG